MNTLTDAQLLVSNDVVDLLDGLPDPAHPPSDEAQRHTLTTLAEHGFIVADRASERVALDKYFADIREDSSDLRLTVLTTLQCNFACDYCVQGDHGAYNASARGARMSLGAADEVAAWAEAKLDALQPRRLVLTFFGGEPLLNLPVLYRLAERLHGAAVERGITMLVNIITNGLLLTRDVVARLKPLGLNGVKITLDGDQASHDERRPLRGGQGTFDRIIKNIKAVAGECRIAIGGNFDAESVASYPALLEFLAAQEFASSISKVTFKPVIRPAQPAAPRGVIPLRAVSAEGKPLSGACMTAAGSGTSPCDSCHFVDEQMSELRRQTKQHGFATLDGVHMGPCEIHRRHAYTIGPEGSLYACPGFAGEAALSVGHIDGRKEARREQEAARFDRVAAWRKCGECPFIPVCAGGCTTASHAELGDMESPMCHRRSFELALADLAAEAACA